MARAKDRAAPDGPSDGRRRERFAPSPIGWLFILIVAGAVTTIRLVVFEGRGKGLLPVALLVVARALLGVFRLVTGLVRRAAARRAPPLETLTSTPFALYLRSFEDDGAFSVPRPGSLWERAGEARLSIEELVVRALDELTTTVAVGRPGEALPPLGVPRYYVGGADWKTEVRGLIDRCRAAVMLLGRTDGFLWEVGEVIAAGRLPTTILLLPRLPREELERRWTKVAEVAAALGVQVPPGVPTGAVAAAFRYDGRPAWVRVAPPHRNASEFRDAILSALGHLVPIVTTRHDGTGDDDELGAEFAFLSSGEARRLRKDPTRPKEGGFEAPSDGFLPPTEWSGD